MGGAFKFERAKLALAAGLFALALLIGSPLIHAQQPGPVVSGQGTYGPPTFTGNGHFGLGNGAPPVISTCGTGPSVAFGTDAAFNFVTGTSASGACKVTPAIAYGARPTCSIDSESATPPAFNVTTAGVINFTSGIQDSTRYNVICFAQPGGL